MMRTPDRSTGEHRSRVIPWLYHMHRVYESHKRTKARRRLERLGRVEPGSDDDDWLGLQSEEDDGDGYVTSACCIWPGRSCALLTN